MVGTTRFWTGGASREAARRTLRGALGGLVGCLLLALGATPADATPPSLTDRSGPASQILAPGEEGGLFPGEFSTDQGNLYDALTPAGHNITLSTLEHDYVSEKFGVQGPMV